MLRLRPIAGGDLEALYELAVLAGPGMTNLPANREVLARRIALSEESFQRAITRPGDEVYLFVLEDTAANRVVGTCGLIACVGVERPFYSFKIVSLIHISRELNRYDPVRTLQMVNDYEGAAELGMLFLHPDYRRDGIGRWLSRARYLFLACFPERFGTPVMAEMRGVSDANGHSVFWDSLGRHFLDMDFSKADFLNARGHYHFIADLMPKHPIYIRLLPEAAQAVIGSPHPNTRPALKLLEREGFRFEGCVDVFDAGPTVHCPLEQITSVQDSQTAPLSQTCVILDGPDYLVSNTELADFRICRTPMVLGEDGVMIADQAAATLGVTPGHRLRYVLA